jgi:hypothetical protein
MPQTRMGPPARRCRYEQAAFYIETAVKTRIQSQIFSSMLPTEVIRPKSYAYVDFTLEGLVRLAMQAERLGIDLWNFNSEAHNSILVRLT